MGPPLPSKDPGHSIGGKDASVVVACWLDYACPFCAKFHKTFVEEVVPHYGDNLRFVFYHQVQPWHPQSTLMHEAAIAVTMIGGEDAFWKFSAALMAGQSQFFDAHTYDKSRMDIYKELAALAAASCGPGVVNEAAVLAKLARVHVEGQLNTGNACTQQLKFHVKLGRQLGIHVSPTTTLNGMVFDSSSGWSLAQWTEMLDPHEQANAKL